MTGKRPRCGDAQNSEICGRVLKQYFETTCLRTRRVENSYFAIWSHDLVSNDMVGSNNDAVISAANGVARASLSAGSHSYRGNLSVGRWHKKRRHGQRNRKPPLTQKRNAWQLESCRAYGVCGDVLVDVSGAAGAGGSGLRHFFTPITNVITARTATNVLKKNWMIGWLAMANQVVALNS